MPESTLLAPGAIVAGYRIDGILGQGGMGVVYRATQLSLNRTIALKVLPEALGSDASFRARFRREGQLQAALDHPHIVTVHEAGEAGVGLFLAMRLVEGATLKDLILTGDLEPRRALRLLTQVADALDSAHAAGLIHRDVKPQNILVGQRDHVYLTDFGLTRMPDDERLTGTGQFVGTIDYVSPEQLRSEAATAASDVYALAGVLYECLTGSVPYPRPTEAETLMAHLTEPPPRASAHRPGLPPAVDDLIAQGLHKLPSQRPGSARELVLAATRAFAGAAAVGPAPSPTAGRGDREATKARALPQIDPAGLTRPAGAIPTPAAATRVTAATPAARRGAPLAALGLGLAAVAAGAFLVGHRGTESEPAKALPNSAVAGSLVLSFPADFERAAAVSSPPGLTLAQTVSLTGAGGTLTAGTSDAGDATLLPAALRSRLRGPLPKPDRVLLGGVQALRYRSLSVAGSAQQLTIYAVATSAGVATIACQGRTRAFQTACDRVAASLQISGARAFALGPDAAYGRVLADTLRRLDGEVAGATSRLRAARTPSGQAAAARALREAYARAASALAPRPINPTVRDAAAAIVGALRDVRDAYARVAAAAAAASRGRYADAQLAVSRSGARLDSALGELTALGYRRG